MRNVVRQKRCVAANNGAIPADIGHAGYENLPRRITFHESCFLAGWMLGAVFLLDRESIASRGVSCVILATGIEH